MDQHIRVEVVSDGHQPEGWIVEAIGADDEGGVDMTTFIGLRAEQRAREYADWKYGGVAAQRAQAA